MRAAEVRRYLSQHLDVDRAEEGGEAMSKARSRKIGIAHSDVCAAIEDAFREGLLRS